MNSDTHTELALVDYFTSNKTVKSKCMEPHDARLDKNATKYATVRLLFINQAAHTNGYLHGLA